MTTPKARPIVFSAPMVRALLDGKKTQTRRPIKPRHPWSMFETEAGQPWPYFDPYVYAEPDPVPVPCPYGQPGDHLWVKEAWNTGICGEIPTICYRATCETDDPCGFPITWNQYDAYPPKRKGWQSPRFMPRELSRITLEITAIRAERLHDISGLDCIAEGLICGALIIQSALQQEYKTLWQSIHGPASWDQNPWVWVIEFRRIAP